MGGNRIGLKHLQQSKQSLLAHPTDVIPMAENIRATEGHKVESIFNELGHGGSRDLKRDCLIKARKLYMCQDCCVALRFLNSKQ